LVLGDVSPRNWELDYEALELDVNAASIRVLPFGAEVEVDTPFPGSYQIIDAAASLGSTNLNLSRLATNQSVVFSLHATKVHGIGEGGIAVVGDPEFARALRRWTNFGFSGSRESQSVATNGKLSEIAAAYGLAVLDNRDSEIRQWRASNEAAKAISQSAGIESLVSEYPGVSPYWIVSLPDSETLEYMGQRLHRSGIQTRSWWSSGLANMPPFGSFASQSFPETEKLANTTLGLPMFRDMSDSELLRVADALMDL